MNSPLGGRKVRLARTRRRGVCGVPRACASATKVFRPAPSRAVETAAPRLQRHKVRLRGLGGLAVYGGPRTCASATGAGLRLPRHVFAAPHTAVTIREGGFCDFPAANSFAPGADSAAGVCAAFHAPPRPQPGVLRPAASRAVETAARKSQSPPPRTRRPGRVRRSTHVCVRNRGGSADPSARIRSASHPRSQSAKADFAIFQRRIHSLLERTRRPGVRRPKHLRVRNRKLIGRSAVSAHGRQKPCPGRSRTRAGFCLP
jgi:hypothetical protein